MIISSLILHSALIALGTTPFVTPELQAAAEPATVSSRCTDGPTRIAPEQAPVRTVELLSYAGGIPMVQITINGKHPCKFLLDTGAWVSHVTPKAAERLKLKTEEVRTGTGSGGEPILERAALVASLQVGDLEFEDSKLLLMDWENARREEGRGVDGAIGLDVLGRMLVELDFSHGKVRLLAPGLDELPTGGATDVARLLGYEPAHAVELRPSTTARGLFEVTARIGAARDGAAGQERGFVVDTAAEGVLLREAPSEPARPAGPALTLRTPAGSFPADQVEATVTVGRSSAARVRCGVIRVGAGPAREKLPELLGVSFLRRFDVLLDFPGRKMYLRPRPGEKGDLP